LALPYEATLNSTPRGPIEQQSLPAAPTLGIGNPRLLKGPEMLENLSGTGSGPGPEPAMRGATPMDRDLVKAYSDKVFASMAGAMTAGMAYVGVKTGLFSAMAGAGPMSPRKSSRKPA
jgi:hypothetical protein